MEIKNIEENLDFGTDCNECNGKNNAEYIILFGTDIEIGVPICENCLKYVNGLWIDKERNNYAFNDNIIKLLR